MMKDTNNIQEIAQAFSRESDKFSVFPIDLLPKEIKNMVLEVSVDKSVPPELTFTSWLICTNLFTQKLYDIKISSTQEPSSLFAVIQAESGGGKTRTLSCFTKIINDLEQKNIETQKEQISKGMVPKDPFIFTANATIQKICKLLSLGHGYLGLITDEGSQLTSGTMKESLLYSGNVFSDIYHKGIVKTHRMNSEGDIYAKDVRLCVLIMAQSNSTNSFLTQQDVREQGLISRILLCCPKIEKIPYDIKQKNKTLNSVILYEDKISDFYSDAKKSPTKIVLNISPEAFEKARIAIAASHYLTLKAKEAQAFSYKMDQHIFRIATTLSAYIGESTVSEKTINAAIALSYYYLYQVEIFYKGAIFLNQEESRLQENEIAVYVKFLEALVNMDIQQPLLEISKQDFNRSRELKKNRKSFSKIIEDKFREGVIVSSDKKIEIYGRQEKLYEISRQWLKDECDLYGVEYDYPYTKR